MLFLGVVMMPFYYGSKVRSVPEFLYRRFGTGAHLFNAISFAVAQLLIAGINLFLLAKIVEVIFGWPLFVSLVVAAAVVLTYTALGGLSAAIYNEVLQFFVIVAALLPLTVVGLYKVGGYSGLEDKIGATKGGADQLSSWPGTNLTAIDSPLLAVIGLVLGLGFVQSFGYWTTNFVEVQRAMASNSISAAQRAPIIGSFPKMFMPFIVILPGMIAGVLVGKVAEAKASDEPGVRLQQLAALPDPRPAAQRHARHRDRGPAGLVHGRHGGEHLRLQHGVLLRPVAALRRRRTSPDHYYLSVGRVATVAATIIAIGTALFASSYQNIMDYLQLLFGFFNAPLFATFILGMFWKRMSATAGWMGLVFGTLAAIAVAILGTDVLGSLSLGVIPLTGQGASFTAAGVAFTVDIVVSVLVTLATRPREEVRAAGARLLADTQGGLPRRRRGHPRVVPAAQQARRCRGRARDHPEHRVLVGEERPCPARTRPTPATTHPRCTRPVSSTCGTSSPV